MATKEKNKLGGLFNWVERSSLLVVIGRFRSILFVSVFHGSLAVTIIMIDGSENCNCLLDFKFQSSHFTENRNKNSSKIQ